MTNSFLILHHKLHLHAPRIRAHVRDVQPRREIVDGELGAARNGGLQEQQLVQNLVTVNFFTIENIFLLTLMYEEMMIPIKQIPQIIKTIVIVLYRIRSVGANHYSPLHRSITISQSSP